jgi:hypothetical protein
VLHTVRRAEPSNTYILAIIERVETLMRGSMQTATELKQVIDATVPGKSRPLPVTIDRNSGPGASGSEPADSIEARVRRLTIVAANLYERGSYDLAFDSLTKAHFLDPTSIHVRECEKKFLPALETLQKEGGLPRLRDGLRMHGEPASSPGISEYLQRFSMKGGAVQMSTVPPAAASPGAAQTPTLQMRLDALKRQKELERKERERAMWRDASKPPRVMHQEGQTPIQGDGQSETSARSERFLTRLKQGKIL